MQLARRQFWTVERSAVESALRLEEIPQSAQRPLRVLHIHISDGHRGGGGGISMCRLHTRLERAGVDSKILCAKRTLNSPDSASLPRMRGEGIVRSITRRVGLNDIHRLGSFRITNHEFFKDADVVHFHGIHSGTFSYLALPTVTRNKPCAFTLHDMWLVTGHCGFSYDCNRWKTGCGRCPYPDSHPRVQVDGTALEWRLKRWVYRRSNLTLITKSSWLTKEIRDSIVSHLPLYEIPCGVDTQIYQPLDAGLCRSLLGLPEGRNVLLFVAQDLSGVHKGSDLLVEALLALPTTLRARTTLLTLGNGSEMIASRVRMPTRDLGYVSSDHLKAIAYSAADLFLFPTRGETFGQVSIESQACGTPVVSFRVGGVPDHVRPGATGYLADPGDAMDFRKGIVVLLEDDSLRRRMRQQCRATVLKEYSLDLEVRRHVELYRTLASTRSKGPIC